jgi:sugar phosphate isomerase/epimerase
MAPSTSPVFATANYVARVVSYDLEGWARDDPRDPHLGGWRRCRTATGELLKAPDAYSAHMNGVFADVAGAGFSAVELWSGHLDPLWASNEHVERALEAAAAHHVEIVSFAADLGATIEEARATCRLASALGAKVIAGSGGEVLRRYPSDVVDLLACQDLRLGIENHPEHTSPQDILALIPASGGTPARIGTTIDTGWWATNGYDPVLAVRELVPLTFDVQLKDVRAERGHDPCRFGEGVAKVQECVGEILAAGYSGLVTIEHLTADHDPTEDCRVNRVLLEDWLREGP